MSEKIEPVESTVKEGNTVSLPSRKKVKQSNQCYLWFFTFNNYEKSDILDLRIKFNKLCKKYIFQEETGEEGTRHLQGQISLKKKARLTEMKKINKKIHWQCTISEEAAEKYCCKEETRTGEVYKHEKTKLFTRTRSKFDKIEPLKEVMDIVKSEPDNRTIHWIYSEEGGMGKTSTAAYLENNHDGVCVANGKKADIKNTVIQHLEDNELDVLIITIPRTAQECMGGLYGVLEEVKDGLIYSGKYEGGFANIEHPHVIVMCNFLPDIEALSKDRWNIINVGQDKIKELELIED